MRRSTRNVLLASGGVFLGTWLISRRPAHAIVRSSQATELPEAIPSAFGLAFVAPVEDALVTSVWGDSRDYRTGVHRGVDLRAPKGSPVRATLGGTVVRVDRIDDSNAGLHVVLKTLTQFSGTLWHRYLHLESIRDDLVRGAFVRQGELVGTLGDSFGGQEMTHPHLHYDQLGDPFVVQRYQQLYGAPVGGIPPKILYGRFIPSEPFLPVRYAPTARKRAVSRGIPVLG